MLVARMYEEFRKTGKLRATLSDDDRTVRELHAAEVLKKPLSTLDAQWPREIGTAHGTGTPARSRKKLRAEKPKAAVAPKTKTAPPPPPTKVAAPAVAPKASAPAQGSRPRLSYDAPVEDAPSIGAKTASRLGVAGIRTVKDLIQASPDGAAAQIKFKHISANVIRDWQAQAELACTVPGLSSLAAQLIVAVGVRDADDLANAGADMLVNMIEEFCETSDGQRTLRDANPPARDEIEKWINAAKNVAAKRAA